MDPTDDVWTAGEADNGASAEELPRVGGLFSAAFDDAKDNFVGFLLSGLGFFVVMMPVVLLTVFGAYAGLIFGSIPGAIAENEALLVLGVLAGFLVPMGLLMLIAMVVLPPLYASLARAMWLHITQDGELGFGAAFSTPMIDAGRIIGVNVLVTLAIFAGAMLCYLPGLVAAMFLSFAVPAVVVHRLTPVEAIGMSIRHVRDNFTWHLGYFGVIVLVSIVVSYIPLFGSILLAPFLLNFQFRAYREIFGEGEVPRGFAAA